MGDVVVSVLVAVYVEAGTAPRRFLILRRPAARAAGWQFVTGKVEAEDGNLEAAARREIFEETGLPPPTNLRAFDFTREFTGYDGRRYQQHHFAAAYHDVATLACALTTPEHEEARWVNASEAARLLTWQADREVLARILA